VIVPLIREYLQWQKEHGRTRSTVESNYYELHQFANYALSEGYNEITRTIVERFARHYQYKHKDKRTGKRVGSSTVKRTLNTLQNFCKYLTEKKRMFLKNPARRLRLPQPDRLPGNIPPDKEIQMMIERIRPVMTGTRDKTLLEVLYSTAIRAAELLNLDVYDVDFENRVLKVRRGKGQKDRIVPLGQKAYDALKIYCDYWRPKFIYRAKKDHNALFISRTGNRLGYHMLLYIISKRRGETLIRPHAIRHRCAIEMLKNGADIRYIQEMLGHASLESTQIYTRLMPIDLKNIHTKYHPRQLPRTLKKKRNTL